MLYRFVLDTNSYYILFQKPEPQSYYNLRSKLSKEGIICFYISEITSMEIHSVLGKYRRGVSAQKQKCDRKIIENGVETICPNIWVTAGRKRMKSQEYKDIRKIINDIENQNGIIRAAILPLDSDSIERAKRFLKQYADLYNFGSHDALIAGTVIATREIKNLDLVLVTSDKGLKAALAAAAIPCYDPEKDEFKGCDHDLLVES